MLHRPGHEACKKEKEKIDYGMTIKSQSLKKWSAEMNKLKISSVLIVSFSFTMLILSSYFFVQDMEKNYHCNKLGILVGVLKNAIIHTRAYEAKHAIVQAAIPILFAEKQAFLRPLGYWPMIFNGYTQAATVENLNLNYPESAKMLLKALHYHPYLSSAFEGLAEVLDKSGLAQEAGSCKRYQKALLKSRDLKNEDRIVCIMAAQKIAGL